jgi:hypothetical protein
MPSMKVILTTGAIVLIVLLVVNNVKFLSDLVYPKVVLQPGTTTTGAN